MPKIEEKVDKEEEKVDKKSDQPNKKKGKKGKKPKGDRRDYNPRGGSNPKKDKGEYCPGNDFAWYSKNPKVLESASNIVFNTLYGYSYPRIRATMKSTAPGSFENRANRAIPGVVVIDYIPWISATGTEQDAINVAAQNLYTWLRHANSGSVNYEKSDLIQYLVSVMSVYALVESLKRDLRLIHTYNASNKYVFRALLLAEGYTSAAIDLLQQNSANYVAQLNIIITKLSNIVIPSDLPILQRWKWLNSNVFRDDELVKASYYMFKPRGIWKYDWANAKTVLDRTYNFNNMASKLTYVELALTALLGYDDVGTIAGDILKAYKLEGCEKIATMSLGEVQDATYDLDAINQIRNATIVKDNDLCTYTLAQVNSNTQILETTASVPNTAQSGKFYSDAIHPNLTAYLDTCFIDPALSVNSDNPTVQEVVEQTRFALNLKYDKSLTRWVVDTAGTEIATQMTIGYFADSGVLALHSTFQTILIRTSVSSDIQDLARETCLVQEISGTNQYVIFALDNDSTPGSLVAERYINGKNVQILQENFLSNVHKACILSEWTLPMFKMLEAQ